MAGVDGKPKTQPKAWADRAVEFRGMIRDRPGIKAQEIADELQISKATVSLVLSEMGESIERVPGPGRSKGLRLSSTAMRQEWIKKRWR